MNADFIDESLKEKLIPLGDVSIDTEALKLFVTMYSIAVENADDLKMVTEEIDNAKKKYYDYYEKQGKLDEFKEAYDKDKENDPKSQMGEKHLIRIMQRESEKKDLKPLVPTGDVEKDARAAVEAYIKLLEKVTDFSDMLFIQEDLPFVLGDIQSHYDEGTPDFEAFNNTFEKIGEELEMQKYMKAFEEKCNSFMALLN